LRLKIDPGARTTGLALVNDATGEVVWAAELAHRSFAVKKSLEDRRAVRRSRRARHTRYRQPRWANRRRRAGWLPPSLESRIAQVLTWVSRLRRLCPLTSISLEVLAEDVLAGCSLCGSLNACGLPDARSRATHHQSQRAWQQTDVRSQQGRLSFQTPKASEGTSGLSNRRSGASGDSFWQESRDLCGSGAGASNRLV